MSRKSLESKIWMLRKRHGGGRGGTFPAEAEINATGTHAIIWFADYEVDRFGESDKTYYWIYDLRSMEEVIVRHELQYSYHRDAENTRELGLGDVRFNPKNPEEIIVEYVDHWGKAEDSVVISLPEKRI